MKDTIRNITITIRFKDDITEFDLPTENQTINLSYQVTYTQYDGGGVIVGPNGGEVTTGKAVLAEGISLDELFEKDSPYEEPFFNGTIARNTVESINFVNNKNVPSEASSTVWDASAEGDNSIIGWYQDTDNNELYEVYIGSDLNIYAPNDCSGMFFDFSNLETINFNNFNTSEVTNMMGMFAYSYLIKNIDLSNFNTSNLTNMSSMFIDCTSLENVNIGSFNTSNVIDMGNLF